MTATDSTLRKASTDNVRRSVAKFYGGFGCVVSGHPASRASLHHLNGNRSQTEFPNLLPVALDLHNGLRRGLIPTDLRPELQEHYLKHVAETHFKGADTSKAYGCLRLAYALSAHFFDQAHRDLETEFQTCAHCLYFLRRCIGGSRLELVYAHLRWLLERDIQSTLAERKVIPPFGAFCLLVELASWLNELGYSVSGLDLLRKARTRLRCFYRRLKPGDISRFQRQLAFALVQMGQYSAELESAIKNCSTCEDETDNNRIAISNARLNLHISKNDPGGAMDVLKQRFEYLEEQTDFFFGPLDRMEPTIMTSLGYIALSLICESQLMRTPKHRQKLEDRLEALKFQERRYGRMTTLNRVPNLASAADQAAKSLPLMQRFLDGRLLPVLPRPLADSILKIASQL